ncbi:BspA family leucine-rich repeat surface protein [Campylobacter peloridis]|uniref:DUF285 domain-containing protein n=1 Tax=Campylobacter peloridis TaxID=488546 RepID=A0ABX6TS87_9BACT|nr:BspA family leucine-rich repeat surface protein [Campylobacter peloridis]AJC84808.1 hypothetical protein (DUF285 domain) [Campylobacter peloridis LMG 23910]MBX1886510.1 DUF285 domain-containing protein [Campylobacter peloridis]QOQ88848.1 DUF285 domain-containing protein [Campylobacter peloridis]
MYKKILTFSSLALFLCACYDNKTSFEYTPKDRSELVALLQDENISLDKINTSNIKDMSFLFAKFTKENCQMQFKDYDIANCKYNAQERINFNGIEKWNMANVENASYMFAGLVDFDKNITNWNVSKLKNAKGMFYFTSEFNQNLNNWDVSNVTNMQEMFKGAGKFNQNLNNWDVSNVTNMQEMFAFAGDFNQDLNSWKVLQDANTTDMFKYTPLEDHLPKWYKTQDL